MGGAEMRCSNNPMVSKVGLAAPQRVEVEKVGAHKHMERAFNSEHQCCL